MAGLMNPTGATGCLIRVRDHARQQRRGQAGPAVPGLSSTWTAPSGTSGADRSGSRSTGRRPAEMSGIDPHRRRAEDRRVALRQRGRHHPGLVSRLRVRRSWCTRRCRRRMTPAASCARDLCTPAAARTLARALERTAGGPAQLAGLLAAAPIFSEVPPTTGDERARRRVVGRRAAERVEVVAVVAGGEQDGHPGRVGHHEQVVERGPGGHVIQQVAARRHPTSW